MGRGGCVSSGQLLSLKKIYGRGGGGKDCCLGPDPRRQLLQCARGGVGCLPVPRCGRPSVPLRYRDLAAARCELHGHQGALWPRGCSPAFPQRRRCRRALVKRTPTERCLLGSARATHRKPRADPWPKVGLPELSCASGDLSLLICEVRPRAPGGNSSPPGLLASGLCF